MKLLAFDTSSKALSVAILEDETLLAETTLTIKKNHSITLMPVIDFLMQQIDLTPRTWTASWWQKVLGATLGCALRSQPQRPWLIL